MELMDGRVVGKAFAGTCAFGSLHTPLDEGLGRECDQRQQG
jgi:hypothetical protein